MEPNICLDMLKEKLPEFRNNKQQDAYEFLNFLWELIIENLEPEKRSDLREKIEGKMKTSTLCHNCNKLKSKVEPFSELSLPFPEITDEYSLKTLLDSYFSPEDFEQCHIFSLGHYRSPWKDNDTEVIPIVEEKLTLTCYFTKKN